MPAAANKYRPVLSAPQILHIKNLCEQSPSEESLGILKVMGVYLAKIQYDAVSPSHTTKSSISLEEALTLSTAEVDEDFRYRNDQMTEEEEIAYEKKLSQS